MRSCDFPNCDRKHLAKGWCRAHYYQRARGYAMAPVNGDYPRRGVTARDALGRKWCIACSQWLREDDFKPSLIKFTDGFSPRCKRCMSLARHGITRSDFDAMLSAQQNACAICKSPEPGGRGEWHVDHDHSCCAGPKGSCGKCVRGVLCHYCNVGIGHLKDDPLVLRAAIAYLERRDAA